MPFSARTSLKTQEIGTHTEDGEQEERKTKTVKLGNSYVPSREMKIGTVNPEYFVGMLFSYISYVAASVRK